MTSRLVGPPDCPSLNALMTVSLIIGEPHLWQHGRGGYLTAQGVGCPHLIPQTPPFPPLSPPLPPPPLLHALTSPSSPCVHPHAPADVYPPQLPSYAVSSPPTASPSLCQKCLIVGEPHLWQHRRGGHPTAKGAGRPCYSSPQPVQGEGGCRGGKSERGRCRQSGKGRGEGRHSTAEGWLSPGKGEGGHPIVQRNGCPCYGAPQPV